MSSKHNQDWENSIVERGDNLALRTKPASLLGSNGIGGARHTVLEISGNASDEALSGYGDKIKMAYDVDSNIIGVQDLGRGVPLNFNEKTKKYNWFSVYADLYASGKYGDAQEILENVKDVDSFDPFSISYLFSIGLNGVGAAATQFTSRFTTVVSVRNKIATIVEFYKGFPVLSYENVVDAIKKMNSDKEEELLELADKYKNTIGYNLDEVSPLKRDKRLEEVKEESEEILNIYNNRIAKELGIEFKTVVGDFIYFNEYLENIFKDYSFFNYNVAPIQIEDTNLENGTTVIWKPDDKVFTETKLGKHWLLSAKDSLQYITGVTLDYTTFEGDSKVNEVYEKGTLLDLNAKSNKTEATYELEQKSMGRAMSEGENKIYILVNKMVLSIADSFDSRMENRAFINTVPTVSGIQYTSVDDAVLDFFTKTLPHLKIRKDDIRGFVGATISTYCNIVSYKGQTKDAIDDAFIGTQIFSMVLNKLNVEFASGNEDLLRLVDYLRHLIEQRDRVEEEMKAFKEAKKTSKARDLTKVHKPCLNYLNNKGYVELIILEGDSAGGTVEQARDNNTQSIYTLSGKFTNILKASTNDVLSEPVFLDLLEIANIKMSMTDYGISFDTSKMSLDKILICTDADVDGYQIRVLLFNLFYRFEDLRELLENGTVEILIPPLYEVTTKHGGLQYLIDDAELEELSEKEEITHLQRFKGLGQMNSDTFEKTTLNPNNRTSVPINLKDTPESREIIDVLFGKDEMKLRRPLILHSLGQNVIELDKQINKENSIIENTTEKDDYSFKEVTIY